MRKTLTFLIAAFALLTMLAQPLRAVGQSNNTETVSYGWETSDDATPWTISEAIVATEGQGNTGDYAGKINTNTTYVQFNEKVFVTSFSFAFKRTSNNNNYSVYIEKSTDGENWTIVKTYAMTTFLNGTYTTNTFEFDGTTDYYIRLHVNNTTAVRYVDDVSISYLTSASSLLPCDLTLTDAPSTLVFDLYDNSSAQVINYTTSSTGEITIADNDYVQAVVNQVAKTITVTPIAVTNGARVITVNQAADDNYASGSATFTINITDSTPFLGGDVTFDAAVDQGTSPLVKNGVTFSCTSGVLNNGSEYRLYKNSVTTFSVEPTSGNNITKIVFTCTSSNPASGFANQDGWDVDNATWEGEATSVSFTASGAQVRATQIVVTVTPLGTDPSISAENVSIAYDATGGEIVYTLNNPVENGSLTAEVTAGDWLENLVVYQENKFVSFNCDPNQSSTARTATVTLTYSYGEQSVSKDVTVTQAAAPVIYTTIPELFAAATSTAADVSIIFGDWVVSGVSSNGKNVFVTDGTNGFVIYSSSDMSNIYPVGSILSGTTECSLKLQNGYAQLSNVDADNLNITSGGTVGFATIEMADLAGVNTGALVHYDNLTCSVDNNKYYLTDGTTTLQIYTSIFDFTTNNLLVAGKTYNISGVYQQYSNTKEVLPRYATDIEEVVSTTPVINADNVTIAYDATSGEIPYTIDNGDATIALTATTTADWISDIEVTNEKVTFTATQNDTDEDRVATFTLSYEGAENKTVTVTQGHYQVDYATLPFAFNGGRADIENTDGLTQEGLGTDYNASTNPTTQLKFDGTGDWMLLHFNEVPGTLTFDIKGNSFSGGTFTVQTSVDGATYVDLAAYTELGNVETQTFDNLAENVRYIKWIYTEKSSGNVGLGDIHLYELGGGPAIIPSITVEPTVLNVDAEQQDGMFTVTYTAIETSAGVEIHWFEATGAPLSNGYEWITAGFDDNYDVHYVINANTGDARTAYFKVYGLDANADEVYSELVTVTQAAYAPPFTGATYSLATTIENGRRYIITSGASTGTVKAMGEQGSNNRAAVDITINSNGEAEVSSDGVYEFIINGPENGLYTIYDSNPNSTGFLYAAGSAAGSGSSNYLRTESHLDSENRGLWTITFDATTGSASVVADFEGRNTMRYNSGSNVFSCYGSGQQPIFLFVKNESAPEYTFYKDIKGYGESENGGYYLIASPIDNLNPENVANMTANNFDLYRFNQSASDGEWENWKAQGDHYHFPLEQAKGYLYANSLNVTIAITGTPTNVTSVQLAYDNNASFKGVNLVGNPFTTVAYIDRPFYRMNEAGTEIVSAQTEGINPLEGIFVEAQTNGETMTFSQQAPSGGKSQVVMNVIGDSGNLIDRAIVRFDECSSLAKFQINPNNTKLYIQQNNNDYAVVHSEANGEMPVNFKADSNGSYTLSFNTENAEFGYLHLIDNKTGNDVDLLESPSYSFDAQTTDYASRFRLVYAKNTASVNEEFAFISNGNLIINGHGILQIVDMMGRIVSTNSTNDHINTNGLAAGVYVLRLTNGENVKTQKIVVK